MDSDTARFASFDPDDLPDEFWDTLRRAAANKDTLRGILRQQSQEQVFAFARDFVEAATQIKDEPFLQHTAPDTSDDGMDDIANWVVSRGKEVYRRVWEHPETIPKLIEMGNTADLGYVAEEVYEERFGEMPDLD